MLEPNHYTPILCHCQHHVLIYHDNDKFTTYLLLLPVEIGMQVNGLGFLPLFYIVCSTQLLRSRREGFACRVYRNVGNLDASRGLLSSRRHTWPAVIGRIKFRECGMQQVRPLEPQKGTYTKWKTKSVSR